MKKVFFKTILPAVLTVLISSCSGFETHPYDVNIKGETGINAKQMAIIEKEFANKEELRIAFISDTHLWIGDARDQVEDVNRRKVDFVVHCGDLTDTATEKEYEWSRDVLMGLNCPFVALIGNHDFLGTGNQTYEVMYGDCDFSFIAGRVKFISESKRRRHSRIALFYEFSTCDLYVRSMFQSSDVKLKDIIGLSIGAKFYTN